MSSSGLYTLEAPLLSRQGILRLLALLTRRDLNTNSSLYDAGYEQAKYDIAKVIEAEMNITFGNDTAAHLARQLRNTQ